MKAETSSPPMKENYPETWVTNAGNDDRDVDMVIAKTLIRMGVDLKILGHPRGPHGLPLQDMVAIHGSNETARSLFWRLANASKMNAIYRAFDENNQQIPEDAIVTIDKVAKDVVAKVRNFE